MALVIGLARELLSILKRHRERGRGQQLREHTRAWRETERTALIGHPALEHDLGGPRQTGSRRAGQGHEPGTQRARDLAAAKQLRGLAAVRDRHQHVFGPKLADAAVNGPRPIQEGGRRPGTRKQSGRVTRDLLRLADPGHMNPGALLFGRQNQLDRTLERGAVEAFRHTAEFGRCDREKVFERSIATHVPAASAGSERQRSGSVASISPRSRSKLASKRSASSAESAWVPGATASEETTPIRSSPRF